MKKVFLILVMFPLVFSSLLSEEYIDYKSIFEKINNRYKSISSISYYKISTAKHFDMYRNSKILSDTVKFEIYKGADGNYLKLNILNISKEIPEFMQTPYWLINTDISKEKIYLNHNKRSKFKDLSDLIFDNDVEDLVEINNGHSLFQNNPDYEYLKAPSFEYKIFDSLGIKYFAVTQNLIYKSTLPNTTYCRNFKYVYYFNLSNYSLEKIEHIFWESNLADANSILDYSNSMYQFIELQLNHIDSKDIFINQYQDLINRGYKIQIFNPKLNLNE
jgi:hypothetical protein